jgi:hypothetical protein
MIRLAASIVTTRRERRSAAVVEGIVTEAGVNLYEVGQRLGLVLD